MVKAYFCKVSRTNSSDNKRMFVLFLYLGLEQVITCHAIARKHQMNSAHSLKIFIKGLIINYRLFNKLRNMNDLQYTVPCKKTAVLVNLPHKISIFS